MSETEHNQELLLAACPGPCVRAERPTAIRPPCRNPDSAKEIGRHWHPCISRRYGFAKHPRGSEALLRGVSREGSHELRLPPAPPEAAQKECIVADASTPLRSCTPTG